MTLTTNDLAHLLLALAVLLAFAHGMGFLFIRLRQPRVIGEILGGLVLGPTVFGELAPELQRIVFPDTPGDATMTVLGAIYQLGLLLLMFCSGLEIRSAFRRGERKTALAVTLTGTLFPFCLGLALLPFLDMEAFRGSAGNEDAFLLVFAVAVAVTSIPVISKILFDLGIVETDFARIVLSAAVLEDIILYVVLAIALGMVVEGHGAGPTQAFSLVGILGLGEQTEWRILYHVVATVGFFAVSLLLGPRLYRLAEVARLNILRNSSPVAYQLLFLLVMTGAAVFLGIAPMFGAFVAGMIASTSTQDPTDTRSTIKTFSFAFFIPVYFAIVGWRLNLLHAFDLPFFIFFLAFACLAKAASVWFGARLAGESRAGALNLAVAMNARGGPGIVLASLAFDAAIVSESFYAILVMLAIVTSLLAGSWLDHVVRSGKPLR